MFLILGKKGGKKGKDIVPDPFSNSELPDIDDDEDVKNDFNRMNEKNQQIVNFLIRIS